MNARDFRSVGWPIQRMTYPQRCIRQSIQVSPRETNGDLETSTVLRQDIFHCHRTSWVSENLKKWALVFLEDRNHLKHRGNSTYRLFLH
jgi:hypothetical protein